MDEIGSALRVGQLLITVMAGIKTADLEARCQADVPVVRVMPNVAALIGCGAAALARGRHATDAQRGLAECIFQAVGETVALPEEALDAVTGLSGSGPGYIYRFVEAMIQGGTDAGLPPEAAAALVGQTLLGAARLLREDAARRSPAQLREAVTSPGGTTAAGLAVLEERGVPEAIRAAIVAATERSRELAGGLK